MTNETGIRTLAAVLLVLATLLPGATSEGASGNPSLAPRAAEAPRWHHRIAPALEQAEAEGKLLLVDLYADWCGWCKKLDVEFRTEHFRTFARDYVLLRVDVEDGGEGTSLQSHLGVRALPTLAIMDHRQVRVGLVQGFKPAAGLTAAIRRTVADWRAERKRLDQQIADGDRETRLGAADRLRAMGDGQAAADVYRGVLAGTDVDADDRVRVGAALADALLMAGDPTAARRAVADARQALEGAADGTPGASLTALERILDTLDLRLADKLGDCQQASALEDFLREHPSSTVAGHARSRLSELRSGPAADCS